MTILITGATGFIGQAMVKYFLEHSQVRLALVVRQPALHALPALFNNPRIDIFPIADLCDTENVQKGLQGCSIVIHAAGRAHIMSKETDAYRTYERVNTEGSLALAALAKAAGVKRFIFLSTIKVHGESTSPDCPFLPEDAVNPVDPYAKSKYEAEKRLLLYVRGGPMDLVILRLPLVYGPGVKGNFFSLLRMLEKGLPLPLGAIKRNKRSLISTDNLTRFVSLCLTHPLAANQIFLISDNEDLSTTELLQLLRHAFKKKSLLLPVPCWLLKWVATLLRKKEQFFRLTSSLQIDMHKAQQLTGFRLQGGVKEALANTVKDYLENNN